MPKRKGPPYVPFPPTIPKPQHKNAAIFFTSSVHFQQILKDPFVQRENYETLYFALWLYIAGLVTFLRCCTSVYSVNRQSVHCVVYNKSRNTYFNSGTRLSLQLLLYIKALYAFCKKIMLKKKSSIFSNIALTVNINLKEVLSLWVSFPQAQVFWGIFQVPGTVVCVCLPDRLKTGFKN